MLRIPYLAKNGVGLSSDVKLLTVRALRNDSAIPKDAKFQIVSSPEKIVSLDPKNGTVVLHALPKGGNFSHFFKISNYELKHDKIYYNNKI